MGLENNAILDNKMENSLYWWTWVVIFLILSLTTKFVVMTLPQKNCEFSH